MAEVSGSSSGSVKLSSPSLPNPEIMILKSPRLTEKLNHTQWVAILTQNGTKCQLDFVLIN